MNGNAKGSKFERDICRRLSLWWTGALEQVPREDVYWRSSQSGGRATQRMKSGRQTFGSYADIAAVDPVGLPLLQVFTIELKRGRSHGDLGDLIDLSKKANKKKRPFENTIEQAQKSSADARSYTWLLICQRDRRLCMVYGRYSNIKEFFPNRQLPRVMLRRPVAGCRWITYLTLRSFLEDLSPQQIIKFARQYMKANL